MRVSTTTYCITRRKSSILANMEHKAFIQTASEVVKFLPGFELTPESIKSEDVQFIRPADGMKLSFINVPRHGEIKVSVIAPVDKYGTPHYADGTPTKPSIYFSNNKAYNVMAADIKRRLLPNADCFYAAAMAKIADYNKYYSERELALKTIRAALGITPGEPNANSSYSFFHYPGGKITANAMRIGVDIGGGQSINISVNNLSQPEAFKLLHFVRELTAAQITEAQAT